MIWLMHQYRQAYDLDREGLTNVPPTDEGNKIRHAIRTADNACFADAKQIYTISPCGLRAIEAVQRGVIDGPASPA